MDLKNLRSFEINQPISNKQQFGSNYIKTTKYSLYSFLPLSILNQYKRIANIYFLALSVLCLIPEISPWDPVTQIVPTIFVLGIAIIREAIEDYYRYKSDTLSNKQSVFKIQSDGTLKEQKSKQILVGDIIWVPNESEVPADILFVAGGFVQKKDGQVECYVKTSSLDGEKNLKKKAVPKLLKIEDENFQIEKQKQSENVYPVMQGQIICELPNKDLNQFHGILKLCKKNQFNDNLDDKFEDYILTENNLLLKGSKVMNTSQGITGVVIYSGQDTKLLQNQNKSRYKQSKVELETNRIVIGMLIYTIIASLVLAWLSYRQNLNYGDTAYYLYNLATEGLPSKNGIRFFIINFLSNICLNCTFIPISLIVAIECTKIVQAFFMISDVELITVEYEEIQESDQFLKQQNQPLIPFNNHVQQNKCNQERQPKYMQQCKVQTCSLNEELGQIRFIFSDKTGTLTRNIMEFRMCEIGSQIYGDETLKENQENISVIDMQKKNDDNLQNSSIISCRSNNEWELESQKSKISRISHRSNVNQMQGATYNYLNQNLENITFNLSEYETIRCPIIMVSQNNNAIYKLQYQKRLVNEFFQCLAIAHECLANSVFINNQEQVTYQGTSPDEVALLEFAQKHGYKFQHATDEMIQIVKQNKQVTANLQNQKILEFELIKKIEFNSDRKRMSVIVKDLQDGLYKMYTKGADNVILERLKNFYNQKYNTQNKNLEIDYNFEKQYLNQTKKFSESEKSIQECKKNLINTSNFLNKASIEGYRTLLIAMKILDFEEVKQFIEECNTAEKDLFLRNKNLSLVYDKWEQDLYLIGATVVEDRLQDQVPETIKALHQADIKLWVLTGDKLETAESIGFSSKLLNLQMDIIRCRNKEDAQLMFSQDQSNNNQNLLQMGKKRAIIIESQALKFLLDNENIQTQRWFLKISRTMETVICCRVSPIQKAEVVRIVKRDDPELISLAIGDGANDVPMILEADIGIGIFGKEGMRAVDSSDYAIAEFRHLWTLLFKWGRWNYNRQCMNINYYFYKNFVYTLFQILFQMSNFYSSQTIFPDTFLSLFNMMFTAWPIACYAVNEIDFYPSSFGSDNESKTVDQTLIQDSLTQQEAYDPALIRFLIPFLYYPGQRCLLFNQWVFIWWILRGLFECLVIYIVTYLVFTDGSTLNQNGEEGDLWTFGMTIFTSLLYVVTNKLMLKTQKFDTLMVAVVFFLSFFFYYMFIYITDSWYMSVQSSFTFYILYSMPIFYLLIVFCVSICFLIDLLFESFSKLILTDQKDLLKLQLKKGNFSITQEFLNEFHRLANVQKNISAIEDELKEQELDLLRSMNSGQTQDLVTADKRKIKLTPNISERQSMIDQNATNFNILSLRLFRICQNMLLRYTNLIPHGIQSDYSNQNLQIETQQEQMNIGYFIKSEKKDLVVDNLEIEEQIQINYQSTTIKQNKNNKVISSPIQLSEQQIQEFQQYHKYKLKRMSNLEIAPTVKNRKSQALVQPKDHYLKMRHESEDYQVISKVGKAKNQQSFANTQDIDYLEEQKSIGSRDITGNIINKKDQRLSFLHKESLEIVQDHENKQKNSSCQEQNDQIQEIESIFNEIALKYQ